MNDPEAIKVLPLASKGFEPFPWPEGLWQTDKPKFVESGERCREHRRALIVRLWLGLTHSYHPFHTLDLAQAILNAAEWSVLLCGCEAFGTPAEAEIKTIPPPASPA